MGSRYKLEKKEKKNTKKAISTNILVTLYMLLSTYEVMYLVLIVAAVTIFFCGYYIIGFFGNIAEGDDELDEEIDLRAKRQREALVCVRPGDESEFLKIKQHQKYTVSTTQKFFQKNL